MKFNTSLKVFGVLTLQLLALNVFSQLSGTVFKDFNTNGTREPIYEIGVGNILVTAFTDTGSPITTRTAIDGSYFFTTAQLPAGTPVRVEFSDLDGFFAGRKGAESNSTVVFTTAGATANASLGLLAPNQYCDLSGPNILTTCYVSGDPLGGGSAGEDYALVTFPYDASGLAGQNGAPSVNYVAKVKEVGSTWGLSYQASTKTFLVAALVRRHSGLGPLGTGGIYKVDDINKVTTPFLDLKTLGINTGDVPHTNLPADKLTPNEDSLSIHAAGKVGIGGITLSQDEGTLYVVNLFDRKLYSLYVGVPAVAPTDLSKVKSYTIPDPSGTGEYRPWSVSEYNGSVYVGVVSSAEVSQDTSKMKAYVYKLDVATGVFTQIFSMPLSYKKGPSDVTAECIKIDTWRAWSDEFPQGCAKFYDAERGKFVNFAMDPQPILSSIGFDADGSMILGFMDRFGLFAGYRNMRPKDDGMLYDGFVGGDVLRAQYDPFGNQFTLENNGISGTLTGVGIGNGEGPGGGEFFGDDVWKFFGNAAHNEITNGGILILPGLGEVMVSAMDPVNEIYQSGGVRTFNTSDGSMVRGFALYSDVPGTLGKSGGVGELKIDCQPTPIEIGNRIWHDKDFDGIQDPSEVGVDDVTVSLYDMDNGGVKVSEIKTVNNGLYCFNITNTPDLKYHTNYEIRVDFSQDKISSQDFAKVSPKGADGSPNGGERDSDGTLLNGVITIPFNSGFPGLTAHKYDIGLIKCESPKAGPDVSVCAPQDSIKLEDAATGQKWIFATGPVVASIDSLTGKATGMTAPGNYVFVLLFRPVGLECSDSITVTVKAKPNAGTDLVGTNAICISAGSTTLTTTPSGGTWTALTTNPKATTISASGSVTGMTLAGFYDFVYSVNGCSDTVKVEAKDCATGSIGDFVWLDTNDNGIQDAGEPGVKDVIVELYRVNAQGVMETTPFMKDTTDANGNYIFNKLPSGSYKVKFVSSSVANTNELSPKKGVGTADNNSDADPISGLTDTIIIDNQTTANSRTDIDAALRYKCFKPSAGTDFAFCAPQSSYKLINPQTGQFWKYITGPGGVVLDSLSGQIDGMSLNGDYSFALIQSNVGVTCSDTIKITRKAKPNAGTDLVGTNAICISAGTTTLTATPSGGTWTALTTNPKATTISASGSVTGMTLAGFYDFVYSVNGCSDTVKVEARDCATGSIGDFVWLDTNDNGIQDAGEPGVAGVILELCRVDANGVQIGTAIAKDTTGTNGAYLFTGLANGSYRVKIIGSSLQSGQQVSAKKGIGTNPALDSDFDPTSLSSGVLVISNTVKSVLTVDAGLVEICKPQICIPITVTKTK